MSENIYTSIRPLHLLSKVSGYSLYSIDGKSFEVKFKKFDAFFAVLHLILPVVLNVMFWKTYFSIPHVRNSELLKNFFPVFGYCNYVAATSLKLWSFCHRHGFAQLLKTLNLIDDDLKTFGHKFDYSKRRNFIFKMIVSTVFVETFSALLTQYAQYYYNMMIKWNVIVFMFYGFYANMIIMNQFLMSISEVEIRLKAINKVIRNNSKDCRTIEKLLKTHLKIVDATALINKILSPLLIFSFFLTFCLFCVFIFTTLIYTEHFYFKFPWFAVANTVLNLHLFLTMLKLLLLCHSTTKTEKETIKLLCQISIDSIDKHKRNKALIFIRQVSLFPIKYSCGLFDFNMKTCFGIISAAATYFVIMIQFEHSMTNDTLKIGSESTQISLKSNSSVEYIDD